MKPETERWLRRAAHDLELATVALDRQMEEEGLFHCQQALEKALKALVTERQGLRHVRRTHDLVSLADELELPLAEADMLLLRRLGEMYVPSRYGDEDVDLEDEALADWLRRSKELFEWLRQQLNSTPP